MAATTPKLKTLNKEISRGDQYVEYQETIEAGAFKLRIKLKSDAYAFQCHATIQVFGPVDLQWNELATIHYASMRTPPALVYQPNNPGVAECFMEDRNNLVRQASAVLGFDLPK